MASNSKGYGFPVSEVEDEFRLPIGSPQFTMNMASDIVDSIITTDCTLRELAEQLETMLSRNCRRVSIARSILHILEQTIRGEVEMKQAGTEALARSKEAATAEFGEKNPSYTTTLAMGMMALLVPWALEILGFTEFGLVNQTFAAQWQKAHAAFVPMTSIFMFFATLGMERAWLL